jgi:drug/metabolite transporter (DMT)-like permease
MADGQGAVRQPAAGALGRLVPYGGLGLLALLWGSSFLFIKLAVVDLGPLATVFGRCCVATAALAAVLAARRRSPFTRAGRLVPRFVGMAVLNSVIPWLGIAFGELTVSSGLTSILNATTPLWTAVLAWWLIPDERPRLLNYLGVTIGFGGTLLLIVPGLLDRGAGATLVGLVAILVAALSYAVASIYQRRWLRDVNPVEASFWQMSLTALMILPLAVPTFPSVHLQWTSVLALFAMGVGASCIGIVIYYWLLNTLGAAGAASVNYLLPVTAVLWGVLILHEAVTVLMVAAAVTVLFGVLLTGLRRRGRQGIPESEAA